MRSTSTWLCQPTLNRREHITVRRPSTWLGRPTRNWLLALALATALTLLPSPLALAANRPTDRDLEHAYRLLTTIAAQTAAALDRTAQSVPPIAARLAALKASGYATGTVEAALAAFAQALRRAQAEVAAAQAGLHQPDNDFDRQGAVVDASQARATLARAVSHLRACRQIIGPAFSALAAAFHVFLDSYPEPLPLPRPPILPPVPVLRF